MRRSAGKWVGGVLALFFALPLCGGLVVQAVTSLVDSLREPAAAPSDPVPTPPAPWPTPTLTAATSTVDGPAFGLAVGTGVRLRDDSGEWTVTVLGVEWLAPCTDRRDPPVLVATVRVSALAGSVRLLPQVHFRFDNGTATPFGPTVTGCGNPGLTETGLVSDDDITGQLAFDVPSGAGGAVTYGPGEPVASWLIPAR